MPWWAECPRSTTHSLSVVCSPATLPSGITILSPRATKPLITASSVHTDMYGLSLGSVLLIPRPDGLLQVLVGTVLPDSLADHVRGEGWWQISHDDPHDLHVLPIIYHEVLPFLLAEMGDWLWVSGAVVCWHLLPWQVLVGEGEVNDLTPVFGYPDWTGLVEVIIEGYEGLVISPGGEPIPHQVWPEHHHAPGLGQTLPIYLALPSLLLWGESPGDVVHGQPLALLVLLIDGG